MIKFGLLVRVPKKHDEFLLPAQLRDSSDASAPAGWPSRDEDALQMRLHFSLTGQMEYESDQLLYTTEEGRGGT